MTVIRDAVIRVRTEQVKSKLEAPDTSAAAAAFEAESKAAESAAKEIEAANEALQEHADAAREMGDEVVAATEKAAEGYDNLENKSVKSFTKAGQGAVQLTRAFALLAVSSEEDSRRILEGLITIEAGVSAAKGAYSLLNAQVIQTTAAMLAVNPVIAAVLVVTAAVVAGAAAWKRWQDSAVEAANRARIEARESAKAYDDTLQKIAALERAERDRRGADEAFAADNAVTASARRAALETQRTQLNQELRGQFEERQQRERLLSLSGVDPKTRDAATRQLLEDDKETQRILQERARIEREILQIKADERRALLTGNASVQGFQNLLGGTTLDNQARRAAEADIKKMEQQTQTTIDAISRTFERLNGVIQKHERELQQLGY